MSTEGMAPLTACEAIPPPIGETFITPKLLPVCCICGLVRDETGFSTDPQPWVTQRTYRETHAVNPADVPLTHTYCPECLAKIQNVVRQYFPEIGASP